MTKRHIVWLIIKLIGVYFAYSAIVAAPGVISSIYAYASLPSPPRFGKAETANATVNIQPVFPNPNSANTSTRPEIETPAEKAKNEALKLFVWNLLATIFYGLIGWYLIRDGRFLYAILSREDPSGASDDAGDAASYSVSKKKEEVVTSLNLSGRKEEITSLNLSGSSSEQVAPTPPEPVASTEMPVQPEPVIAPDTPVNLPDEAPVKENISAPVSLSDSAAGQTEQPPVFPVETTENTLLEIPEDDSIKEQKY